VSLARDLGNASVVLALLIVLYLIALVGRLCGRNAPAE
jgi:hypothetical protein